MAFQGDSIYWVELEKVVPNPFQPRREFDQKKLEELSESIRMYGVLQPLTVTRKEVQRDDGTFYTEYELIAGERRLRASKLAGVAQVPVIIREGEQSEQEKLELAIIENLQREDLNAVDRALAFRQLADSFGLSHAQVAQKVGRSREYVSNSIRLLGLPDHILDALKHGDLMEGHARTLLMLTDRPEEQEVIFREVVLKKLSVREVERIVRKIATDRVRKKTAADLDVSLIELEKQFTEKLGTRVQIQKTDFGGKLTIDYFSEEDLSTILQRIKEEAQDSIGGDEDVSARITASTGLDISPGNDAGHEKSESLIEKTETTHTEPQQPSEFEQSLSPNHEGASHYKSDIKSEDEFKESASQINEMDASVNNNQLAHESWRPTPEPSVEESVPPAFAETDKASLQVSVPETPSALQESIENIHELRNYIADHQTPTVSPHPEKSTEGAEVINSEESILASQEASQVANDEDDSDLYSIRNFNV